MSRSKVVISGGAAHGTSRVCGGDEKRKSYNTSRYSTRHKRMKQEFDSMSDEELIELTKQKAPNKCATELAIEAQKYLFNRKQTLGY